MSNDGTVTFTGVADPWMCDSMGHVNVRHYAPMFDDASLQLLGRVAGEDPATTAPAGPTSAAKSTTGTKRPPAHC